jgi:hypothetical protein
MANERLGAQTEVVFHIEEGSFYNCVMPGKLLFALSKGGRSTIASCQVNYICSSELGLKRKPILSIAQKATSKLANFRKFSFSPTNCGEALSKLFVNKSDRFRKSFRINFHFCENFSINFRFREIFASI